MKYILFLILLIPFSSLYQKQISGCYSSKSTKHNPFVTRIQLNENGTFRYEFKGDLVYNWGDGIYKMDTDHVIFLNFGKSDLDSTQQLVQSLSGGHEIFGTMLYVFRKGKLYPLEDNGQINTKGRLGRIEDCDLNKNQN